LTAMYLNVTVCESASLLKRGKAAMFDIEQMIILRQS
jgi:hypothetical protein